MEEFSGKVYAVVGQIPRGAVLSYTQVARLAGRPKAARAVGNILSKNYDPQVPCHRVVRVNGALGGYNRGATKKKNLLRQEGALD